MKDKAPKFYGAVAVGERGQIVIPAEARTDLKIAPGEKLIIMGDFRGGLMIVKRETISQMLSKSMEHMSLFENLLKQENETPE